ncbi:MAG: thiamine-phosphate kinase [bacterium]
MNPKPDDPQAGAPNPKLKDLGEFGLIEHLKARLKSNDSAIAVNIGDDAAALKLSESQLTLITADILIEGVHFTRDNFTPFQIGWKAMAANVSDIAAMGGKPRWAVISLGLPPTLSSDYIDCLYNGMEVLGNKMGGIALVGGDTVSSRDLIISISLLGLVEPELLTLRSGARVGNYLAVTGTLGDSALGLELLSNSFSTPLPHLKKSADELIEKHLQPLPRLEEARRIVESKLATAMIDISDGLAAEVKRIVEASGVGIRIFQDQVPLSYSLMQICEHLGMDPLRFSLGGGEDYELLFTFPPERQEEIKEGMKASLIGRVVPESEGIKLIDRTGKVKDLPCQGYDHFRSQRTEEADF